MSVLAQLHALAANLWWTWDTEATALWPALDAEAWERTGHNPVALLAHLDGQIDPANTAQVDGIHARMCTALAGKRWADEAAPEVQDAGVLYLSMEFGLHESLPLYSGGLGVLAGDHLRSASDLGVRMTGVGLLWREGYFRQRIEDGQQVAWYDRIDETGWPLVRVTHQDAPLYVEVPLQHQTARLAVWRLDVGRVPLYLLDADVDDNLPAVRALTRRLYSGGGCWFGWRPSPNDRGATTGLTGGGYSGIEFFARPSRAFYLEIGGQGGVHEGGVWRDGGAQVKAGSMFYF